MFSRLVFSKVYVSGGEVHTSLNDNYCRFIEWWICWSLIIRMQSVLIRRRAPTLTADEVPLKMAIPQGVYPTYSVVLVGRHHLPYRSILVGINEKQKIICKVFFQQQRFRSLSLTFQDHRNNYLVVLKVVTLVFPIVADQTPLQFRWMTVTLDFLLMKVLIVREVREVM